MKYTATIGFAVMLLALGSCSGSTSAKEEKELSLEKHTYQTERNSVEVIALKKGTFQKQLISNGRLRAKQKSVLAFKLPGTVAVVRVKEGEWVESGREIARLDTEQAELEYRQAVQSLQKAEIDLQDVLIGFGYGGKDSLQVPAEVMKTAAVRSGYLQAKSNVERAQLTLQNGTLHAPFAGKIANIKVRQHEQTREAFCTLIDDRTLDVEFNILETEIGFVSLGQVVKASSFVDPEHYYTGRVTAINPSVDEKGQVQIRAEINNPGKLLDGMNVKILLENSLPDQLIVPKNAVVIRDNLEVLFRYSNGKAMWTYVHTLLSNSDSHSVTANTVRGAELNVGDSIIVSGNLNLADGSLVELAQ